MTTYVNLLNGVMADNYLKFNTGSYFKPFEDNLLVCRHSGDRGVHPNPVEEGLNLNAFTDAEQESVTEISQTTPGNVASTGELVTGMLTNPVKNENQGNHTPR